MDKSLINVSSNWSHIGGCTLVDSIQQRSADPDVFIRPHVDELVNGDKSVLLGKEQSSDFCELYVEMFAHYKIQALSFVCNVAKVEIFYGPIREYLLTIYGVIVDESDDQFKNFRYDIEVEKSGVTDLTLRFLTDSNDVCIFGVILHTAPNPNGITTLLPNSGEVNINFQKILHDLSKQHNPTSEKFKILLDLMTKSNQCGNTLTLDQLMKQKINTTSNESSATDSKDTNYNMTNCIKLHIDERFQKMELHINQCLKDMEQRQNKKLENILNIMQKINNKINE